MINNTDKELTIIYHSGKEDDRKARGYAESLDRYVVKSLDLRVEDITETQLAEIADMMKCNLPDLMDDTFSDADKEDREKFRKAEGSDILKILVRNKRMIKTPIIIVGKRAYHCGSGYYLLKEDMAKSSIKSEKANIEEINSK